ncbi:MAG: acetyl-coenzyme A synthetase N-terminal domain-containing protein, partial [Dehalococcoidia bacterium]
MTSSNDKTYWPKNRYLEVYNRSIEDIEGFWADEARKLDWSKTWDKVLEWNAPFSKWFVGGELNASYLCVDRHAKSDRRNKVAYYFEGEPGDT